ncbi:hypothetical protein SZ64_04325 [Erythrobacter sp. SG61-1L]|uniref:hypothetical protein n=1 Tax=Erythrobacter sp. SG61-1L TaxID=1603897 RepID=UPI0006C8FFBB|nr:hypothetical protein [Erythrobacter sp. SG61-1L]KPL67398.1 hypothetical protein SZ64_04325 [Erythrobacter sp. SG61-1L]
MTWLATLLRKPIAWAIVAALLALGIWWLVSTLLGGATAKTEARLGKNTAQAAIQSGNDAVNTIGTQMAGEAATDALTRENAHDIRNAPGANAPVDPAAHAAGIRSLCKRAAYRERPECLQHATAR